MRVSLGERDAIQFMVIDQGVGIARERLADIFNPFVQADSSMTRRFGGTGLGLAITRRLVEVMGGSIGVDSEIGKGSAFTVDLPLDTCDETQPTKKLLRPTARKILHDSPLRILIAEDNRVNALVARRLLEKAGHQVTHVENGREAFETVRRDPDGYDVVLMDVQMPEMDGLEATRAIRGWEVNRPIPIGMKRRRLPILGLTANAVKGDDQTCFQAGMDAYIPKPIDRTRLMSTIAQVARLDDTPPGYTGRLTRPTAV
jgi:CheY-like chemotaxis protein